MTIQTLLDVARRTEYGIVTVDGSPVRVSTVDFSCKTLSIKTTSNRHYFTDIHRIKVNDGKANTQDSSGRTVELHIVKKLSTCDPLWHKNCNIHIRTVNFS